MVVSERVTRGDLVGLYRIEESLGEGGMGEVWRGVHTRDHKQVAIKFMSRSFLGKASALARFQREIRAVQEVRHKNIVDIYEEGALPNGLPFYVMEFLQGKLLRDYMTAQRLMPLREILALFKPLCRALHTGHEIGIIHRDLKPDNIFLVDGKPEDPKILDFGIAKVMTEVESLTRTGAMIGTPLYMSPEQCKGTKSVDRRADIYALGLILFELLAGRSPFQEPEDDPTTILSKQLLAVPPRPSTMVRGRVFSKELEQFVLKTLEKNPSKRPSTTLLFFEELQFVSRQEAEREDAASLRKARPLFEVKVPFIGETPPPVGASASAVAPTLALSWQGTAEKPRPRRSWLGYLLGGGLLGLLVLLYLVSQGAPPKAATRPVKPAETLVINISEEESLLRLAAQHGAERQWREAREAAEKAGHPEKAKEYQAELDAREQVSLCERALQAKDPERLFADCERLLHQFHTTATYQESAALAEQARAQYKGAYFSATRSSLDRAMKQASFNADSARKQLTTLTKRILDLQSFVGTQDQEVARLTSDFITVSGKLFKTSPLSMPAKPPCIKNDPLCGISF